MLPSDCYIDALWLEAYDNQTGQDFELSQVVIGTPAEVFDAWIHDVWLAGGDQVHEGVGRGYVGSVRRVPLHVEEEILSAGIPEASVGEQSASIKIPSICYRVCKPGPFPLQSHLAMTEMSRACSWLHCGGLIRLVFRLALRTFLRSLAKKQESKQDV
ncbi:uncharacterized protein PITG_03413 [Phytophthora infestans T30-4]|uniref:Uncharacterized protein n=1 Tax=Phytophthora infestans (strain T30-4) TaxID=403677 RepID=D0N071_PHYIT|nr:uncharacterized protein PITG_03413 [Phytophthora infestans T30-4]EEY65884.1 conserved hypothetical protein [Phytophthora infestans T30-4]|eukprot:XP_002906483.1 conserved hypothetical protein [Phytophthora infestans T30-4]